VLPVDAGGPQHTPVAAVVLHQVGQVREALRGGGGGGTSDSLQSHHPTMHAGLHPTTKARVDVHTTRACVGQRITRRAINTIANRYTLT